VAGLGVLVDEVAAGVREHVLLEREVTNYWLARYFQAAARERPGRAWPAVLLHWIRQVRARAAPWVSGADGHCSMQLVRDRGAQRPGLDVQLRSQGLGSHEGSPVP
jgi:hypothetical protein